MNRLSELHRQLSDEWRLLNTQWQKAEANWRDDSQNRVAKSFWDPLERDVPPALRELEDIILLVEALERRLESS